MNDKQSAPTGSTRFTDPQEYLLSVMNDRTSPAAERIEAAAALMPYFYVELGEESHLSVPQEDVRCCLCN